MFVADRPIFYIHIMKTGGTTFKHLLKSSFEKTEYYPNNIDDKSKTAAATDISYLCSLSEERRLRTKVIAGHFPYAATRMIPSPPPRTVTLLREPVSRVISHVRQIQANPGGWRQFSGLAHVKSPTLLDVYRDQYLQSRFFLNHQLKMFAMSAADKPRTYVDVVEISEESLETAVSSLEEVDCIGLMENYEEFVNRATRQFGLKRMKLRARHVSKVKTPVPAELREMITRDNALEIEFYRRAKRVVNSRLQATD